MRLKPRAADTRGYDKAALGQRLVELRKGRGLTQKEVSEKTGIKLESIRKYESGDSQPYGKNLRKLADVLIRRKAGDAEGSLLERLVEGLPPAVAEETGPPVEERISQAPGPLASSGDLARLLDTGISPPPRRGNPAALLHARHHVVPFYEPGRATLLADIAAWCRDPEPVSLRVFVGPGGIGKTRLFTEVSDRMRAQGWPAGFAQREADFADLVPLLDAGYPTLVVVDYAESRAGLRALLRLIAERRATRSAPLRVVLLARAIGDWWEDLCGVSQDVGVMLREQAVTDVPPLAHDESARREVFQQAVRAFAKHQDKPIPTEVPALDDAVFERALYLHIAALLAVEGRETPAEELMENVLEHEERFWAPSGAGNDREQRLVIDGVRRIVTALTLMGGAADTHEAEALVERVGGRRDAELVMLLHDLYAGPESGTAQRPHVTGLEPHLLGEAMVRKALQREGGSAALFLGHVLDGAGERAVENAFDLLGRISATHPQEARAWIRAVLARDIAGRAIAALAAAMSVGLRTAHAVLGEELAAALERVGTVELAQAIEGKIPEATVSLREVHAWALRQCLATLPASDEESVLWERGRLLNNLGKRQQELGQREAALVSVRQAVDLYRKVAAAHPDALLPDLAGSLSNLGSWQSDAGQWEAALPSAQEAVELYRKLAETDPDTFLPYLAMSLNNLSNQQSALGQREAALASIQEAVDIRRELAGARPDTFLPDFAASLTNLGVAQSEVGRWEEGLRSTQEAADTYRKLAAARPDAFLPEFATSLHNLGAAQSKLGQREGALVSTQEAVDIRRKLAAARPEAFLPDLATSLHNLGAMQSDVGRQEAALASPQEAVDIYRKLAEAYPEAFLPDLASSLDNLGNRQSDLDQWEAALISTQDGVDIRRKLAAARPEAFLPDLATSLHNLGKRQRELGQQEVALTSTQEAVNIRRKLVAAHPEAFLPDLARSLHNLGGMQRELGQPDAALASVQEAIDIYSKLAEAHPKAFLPDLAVSLNNLSEQQSAQGQREAALVSAREALNHLWPFYLDLPAAFAQNMANILSNTRRHLAALDQSPDADFLERVAHFNELTCHPVSLLQLLTPPTVAAAAVCPCGSDKRFAECHGVEIA